MSERKAENLRVLIANEPKGRLAVIGRVVATLGHHGIPWIEGGGVAAMIAQERPDVALVGIGEDSERALELIDELVHEAACPVIALIHAPAPDFVREASKRGVFAYITNRAGDDWQSAIDIGLRRFGDFRDLEAAFARRAVIERAKGILMERHAIDEATAFRLLRDRSRTTNRRLIDVVGAVAGGHALLSSPHGLEARSGRVPPSVPRRAESARG